MIDILKSEIGKSINKCHQKTRKETFFVLENEKNKGVLVNGTDEYHLAISNPRKTEIYLIQNEECVMHSKDGKQCDWILLNKDELYFIENKKVKNKSRKRNAKNEAYKQFESTFSFYSKAILRLGDKNLFAIVCFPSKLRVPSSSESTKKKEFRRKYNINLLVQNFIEFS